MTKTPLSWSMGILYYYLHRQSTEVESCSYSHKPNDRTVRLQMVATVFIQDANIDEHLKFAESGNLGILELLGFAAGDGVHAAFKLAIVRRFLLKDRLPGV